MQIYLYKHQHICISISIKHAALSSGHFLEFDLYKLALTFTQSSTSTSTGYS